MELLSPPDPKPEPRKKRSRKLSPSQQSLETAAAKKWHDMTVAFGCQVCPKLGQECEGTVMAHHILRRQFIMDWVEDHVRGFPEYLEPDSRAMLEREVMWDLANGMGVCYRAHRRHHNRTQPIPAMLVPAAAWEFARRLGLTRRLEQDYPE